MAGITLVKEKGKVNIYRTLAFRDTNNKPQNHRKLIGEYDEKTNKAKFNTYFRLLIAEQGISEKQIESTPIRQIPKIVNFGNYTKKDFLNKSITNLERERIIRGAINSTNTTYLDLIHSTIKNITLYGVKGNNYLFTESNISCQNLGSYLLLTNIVKSLDLLDILIEVFPDRWEEILTISYYLVTNNSPLMYCHHWTEYNNTYIKESSLQSQRITELLEWIGFSKSMQFYEKGSNICIDDEYLALDITSVSSYSKLISQSELGYNRDNEKLKQINICMVFGENSGLPLYASPYSGSINDVKALMSFIGQLDFFSSKIHKLVMDKGFYSHNNIKTLIRKYPNYKFLLAVPFTTNIARQIVSSGLTKFDNTSAFEHGDDILLGYSFIEDFDNNNQLEYHVFYNKKLYQDKEMEKLDKAIELKTEAQTNPEKYSKIADFTKYLNFKKDKNTNKYTIEINNKQIAKELRHTGWFIIVTNEIGLNYVDVLSLYRRKDCIEKAFCRLKNNLDLKRLRIHDDNRLFGKLFISIIALILNSYIYKTAKDHQLLNKYTIEEIFKELDKIKMLKFDDKMTITPISKNNRYILESFGFKIKESDI
jgi:transposase